MCVISIEMSYRDTGTQMLRTKIILPRKQQTESYINVKLETETQKQ